MEIAISLQRIREEAVNHFLASCILYPSHFYPVSRLKNPPLYSILYITEEQDDTVPSIFLHYMYGTVGTYFDRYGSYRTLHA